MGGLRGHVGVPWGTWGSYRELRGPIGCMEVLQGTEGFKRVHGVPVGHVGSYRANGTEGAWESYGGAQGTRGGLGDMWGSHGAHGGPVGHLGVL